MKIFPVFLLLPFLLTLPAAKAGAMAPIALNSLGSVPAKIAAARVLDRHGAQIGTVARVERDAKGKPQKVTVTLISGGTVTLDAWAMGYDNSANVLVTDQPATQAPAR